MSSSVDEIEPGRLIAGRYQLIERVGSGGMATVFAAEDTLLGRSVALKRLRSDAADRHAERFRREARIGAGLNHPSLASVFDVISEDDMILIVMELVRGRPLNELIADGPIPPARALELLAGIAAALDYAHRAGIVHRDVKPANVLITPSGEVKLVDLGIASASESTRLTGTHEVIGTLTYLAPERLSAASPAEGPADIYSLAVVAVEMLTGSAPWKGSDPTARLREAESGPPELADRWPTAPPAALAALRRSLEPQPSDRHPSAGALVDDLRAAFEPAGATIAAGSRGARTEISYSRRPAGRYRALAAGLTLVGLAAALVLALAGQSKDDSGGSTGAGKPAAERGSGQSDPTRFAAGGTEDAGQGSSLNDQGYALLQRGDPATAIPVLRDAVKAFPSETDDIAYAYALFNLARAYRLNGQPAKAVPLLEARLRIPDQPDVVQAELDAARAALGADSSQG